MRAITAGMMLTVLTACGPRSLQPVDIEPSDMCGYCRMAISQRQFAAETLDAGGNPVKFDDIGCMLRYAREHEPAALFVIDYETRKWVEARNAFYLRGSRVPTPMGGGILAFGERSGAETGARNVGGQVVSFEQVFQQ